MAYQKDKRTKIVATIGPVSQSKESLRNLIESGMNVARLNFSHGKREEKLRTIRKIQKLREEMGRSVGILQDLSGPKIRVGILPDEGLNLRRNDLVRMEPIRGGSGKAEDIPVIPIDYAPLLEDLQQNHHVLMDDGKIELKVEGRDEDFLTARVLHGGRLVSRKGVNFPGVTVSERAPTEKDIEDLRFGLEAGVDFVALSFVQDADDIRRIRKEVQRSGRSVSIIAKIERASAMTHLDEIMEVSDGVMIARGDLGLETDLARVPVYQKLIVRKANQEGILVITATQMLDSMIESPYPTRAEVADVANAIYDGTDAVMLSGETAVGQYPVESVRMMSRVAREVEENLGLDLGWERREFRAEDISEEMVLTRSACSGAIRLKARYIVAHTLTGRTARLFSQQRPAVPIVALTSDPSTFQRLSLAWGVEPIRIETSAQDLEDFMGLSEKVLLNRKMAEEGDLIVISAGIPPGVTGGTNIMKIHRIRSGR